MHRAAHRRVGTAKHAARHKLPRRQGLQHRSSEVSRLPRTRPSIEVRLRVAYRQLGYGQGVINEGVRQATAKRALGRELDGTLRILATFLHCEISDLRLDHNPALENREKLVELPNGRKHRTVIVPKGAKVLRYFPAENDPDYLFYRAHGPQFVGSHLIKTNVRGDGAQHSDRALAAKNKNIARNRDPKRRKAKLKSRGFQKGPKRKWPNRSFR